jgi:hypothetical protein
MPGQQRQLNTLAADRENFEEKNRVFVIMLHLLIFGIVVNGHL